MSVVLASISWTLSCGRSDVGLLDEPRSGGGNESGGHVGSGGDGAASTAARGGDGVSGTGGRGRGGGAGAPGFGGASGAGTGAAGAGGSGANAGASGDGGAEPCDSVAPNAFRPTPFSFQFGDPMNQSGRAVLAAPDGSLFVAGTFEGTLELGGGTYASGFGDDPFVARYDRDGRHLFSRHFAGSRVVLFDMDSTSDGRRLYCAGDFSGTADFGAGTTTSQGLVSAFLVALDACGNVEELRVFGGEGARVSIANIAIIQESVVVAGTFEGTLDLGAGSWTAESNRLEAFVARFDRSLELIWSYRLGGAGHLVVTADEDKNVYVAGSLNGTLDVGTTTVDGFGRTFVLKLGSDGTPRWYAADQIEELGSSSWPEAIILNEDGNVVVLVDLLYKPLDFGGSVNSDWVCCGQNVFALGLHRDGVPLRLTPIDRLVTARIAPAKGGFIVATSDGGESGFEVKRFDLFGAVTSSERFATTSYVDVFGVSEEESGSLLVTGQFRGALDLGSGPFEPTEEFDWDGFVARLSTDTLEPE